MDENTKNYIMAIVLSIVVLVAWQVFYAGPKIKEEQERLNAIKKVQIEQQKAAKSSTQKSGVPLGGTVVTTRNGRVAILKTRSREEVLKDSPRIVIDTDTLQGSIALKGGRIDDLTLNFYHETVDKSSPLVTLLSPSGTKNPYYSDFGWIGSDPKVKVPGPDSLWSAVSKGPLTPSNPASMQWNNGQGLVFKRTISIDENYMFSIKQVVENKGSKGVDLFPFSLVARHGLPETSGLYILHEGLVGVMGEEDGLQEIDYDDALDDKQLAFKAKTGWIGITGKYWAAVLIPDQKTNFEGRFIGRNDGARDSFQTDLLLDGVTIPKGGSHTVNTLFFAGAKKASLIEGYGEKFNIDKFDLLIDWGWLYFITKPIFHLLDYFYKMVGNFGIAIMIVTVILKVIFFPLNNKSYKSMTKMKLLAPEMAKIKERYADDRMKQQEATMELYKKEKVNPMSGCVPILFQIPVFFALYKVLYGTIEMRHAPFFGWIQDLSAKDPTSLFNLFGLMPFDVPQFLVIGAWPIMMGISMWLQMQLNPQPTDEIQKMLFAWMPLMFVFILAPFAAGLVIYWTWNNTLTIAQQSFIMHRAGAKIELFDNIKSSLSWLKKDKAE